MAAGTETPSHQNKSRFPGGGGGKRDISERWHGLPGEGWESSSKRHVTSLSEQLTKNYHIQRYEFSQQQQLLLTGTSSCSAPATTPQDPGGLPPTQPLPPTTTADHLIPRAEIIQHRQLTITGDKAPSGGHGPQKLLASFITCFNHVQGIETWGSND
ncbi:hypothetical protein AVEN_116992-1 [Araneus ventricosus]|uniref:Uncharacterized protein n=1 Tax=Araneus ventricosus TaxID=182803 RepID=A0A4Y2UZD7_ARAVE|nr:hypothetical protein AVEN_116992-1 [Araneus ventricosus]